MFTAFSIAAEELGIESLHDAHRHLDLLEGIEDHPSEDVRLLKEALRDFIREQEGAV